MNGIDKMLVVMNSNMIALLKCADDLVLISRSSEGLQKGLDALKHIALRRH